MRSHLHPEREIGSLIMTTCQYRMVEQTEWAEGRRLTEFNLFVKHFLLLVLRSEVQNESSLTAGVT